jgi:hypothetical protein
MAIGEPTQAATALEEARITISPLAREGRQLPADQDHLLARVGAGALLLINVPPGEYRFETHRLPEYILTLEGTLVLETDTAERFLVKTGEMATIAPGVSHRFASDSQAVIMTIAQQPPSVASAPQ